MKVLVTGAAGFIGFHLVKKLINNNYKVVGLDNINNYYDTNLKYARLAESGIYAKEETNYSGGINRDYKPIKFAEVITSINHPEYRFIRLNLEDKAEIERLFSLEKFDCVINLAAQAGVRYSIENPECYIQSNVVGFLNILEACRRNTVKHFLYASSSSVYGANAKIPFSENDKVDQPVSLYAATKKSNELMAHAYSHLYAIPTSGLRFFTVYGPWGRPDMAPMLFAKAITKGESIKVFNNGDMERDFTYIEDIVDGIFKLIHKSNSNIKPPYQIFNIGNGKPVNLLKFIKTIENTLGIMAIKQMMPMQDGDVKITWADLSMLQKNTNYESKTPIQEGVKEFIGWYRTFYNLVDNE